MSGGGRAIAWLEVDAGGARLALYGGATEMRALAAAAVAAAEQAEELGGVAERLRVLAGGSRWRGESTCGGLAGRRTSGRRC